MGLVPFVRELKRLGKSGKENTEGTSSTKEVTLDTPTHDHDETQKKEAVNDAEARTAVKIKPGINDEGGEEDVVDRIQRLTGIVLADPNEARRRWKEESLEDECYIRDEPSLHLVTEGQECIGRRAVCVSTVLRNLSFVPGNEFHFGQNANFLATAGKLLLLSHWHPKR